MPQTTTKYGFYQEASLSQKLAHRYREYIELAGSDKRISLTLAMLLTLHKHKKINLESEGWSLVRDLLNMQRMALFATSEKTNEITKMGLQMPKAEDEFYGNDDDTPPNDD